MIIAPNSSPPLIGPSGTKGKKRRTEDLLQVDNEQHEKEATDVGESANETIVLKAGMLLACFVPKYKEEEPQIGTVVRVPDEKWKS